MNRTLIRKVVLVASLVSAAVVAPSLRADSAGHDDAFHITLPQEYAAFTKQAQNTSSPEGEIRTTNWVSKSASGSAVVVTMSRMPGPVRDPEKLMTSTRDSLLKSLGATLESEQKREGDLPSSRLLFNAKGAYFRSRLVVDNDRLFQVLYVSRSAEERTSTAVTQVFDSFRINRTAASTAAVTGTPAP